MILSSYPLTQAGELKYQNLDKLLPLKPLQEPSLPAFFKIPRVEESGAVIFQDKDVIKIDSDFINSEGELLATIRGLAMKAGICPSDEELTDTNTENEVLLIPTESDIIIYRQDALEDFKQEKIIKPIGDLTLISENGTIWSKHGHIYAPDKKVIIQAKNLTLEDFDIVAREVEIQGELAQFTNVRFFTSDAQNLNLKKADFHKVNLQAEDGPLVLTHENLGLYSESSLFSQKNSIDCFSEGILQFLDTESLAAKEIRQEASDIVSWDSSYTAGENLTQYAAGTINSYNTILAAEDSVSLDGESISTDDLTVIANTNIKAHSVKQGRYVNGRFHARGMTTLSSQNEYLDLSKSELDSKTVKAEASQQLMMPQAKVKFGEKAEFISQQRQIEAQGSQIATNTGDSEITFQAKHGTIHLNENNTQPVKKVLIAGKYVELRNSNVNSIKEAIIHATRIEGKDSTVTCQSGNIKIRGEKSLQSDNVQKRALKGQITQKSKQWISEKNSENESVQVMRSASEIDLIDTRDMGTKVHLVSTHRFNASGYEVKAKEAFTLQAEEIVKIEDCSINTKKLALQADELWLSRNRFSYNQLTAKSRALNMQSTITEGHSSLYQTREGAASFYNNRFKSRLNQIKAGGSLSFERNAAEGNQKISSKEDLHVISNAFSHGNVDLKSTKEDTLLQNSVFKDTQSVQIENPHGTANINKVDLKSDDLKIQAQQVDVQNSRLASNTLVEGDQAAFRHTDIVGNHASINVKTGRFNDSTVQGKNGIDVHADHLSGKDSDFRSESKTVKMEANQQRWDHVTMQGVDVIQKGSELTILDTVTKVSKSVTREADTIVAQGGGDEAKTISEKAKKGIFSERSSTAEEKNEMHIENALLYKNSFKGSEINLKGHDIQGAKNNFDADKIEVDGDKVQLFQTKADASLIEVKAKEEAALPLSKLKGAVIIENGNAPIDVGHGEIEGTFIAKSEGQVLGPNLQVKGKDFGVEANAIWMPGVKAESEKVVLNAKDQSDLSKGDFKADLFAASAKDLHASQVKVDVKEKVQLKTWNEMDLRKADLKGGTSFDARNKHLFLDGSNVVTDSITLVGKSSLSAQDSTLTATKELTAVAHDLRMVGMKAEAEKIGLEAKGFSNISQADLKTDSLTVIADTLQATELKSNVTKDANLQAKNGMNLNDANMNVGGAFDARAHYLFLDRAKASAASITAVGKTGISAQESHLKAEEELTQASDHAILAQGSHLQAKKIVQQADHYIDHKKAENKAEKNVLLTSFFDNSEGIIAGNIQSKTKVFNNSGGQLQLDSEISFIETENLFNNEQSKITGPGSFGIKSSHYHREQSQIQLGGTYQLQASGATIDSSIKAKEVFVDATPNRQIDVTQRGSVESESATFISSKFNNKGRVRTEILEVDQNNFEDIGDAIGSEHLIHRVDSSIHIDWMKTPGSLTLCSRQSEVDIKSLDVGNDLTLQAHNRIHIDGRVHAAGRGVLLTPGMCHLDHAKVSFNNGIDADVGTFYSQASDINIQGKSKLNSILCKNFRLKGEMEAPIYKNRGNSGQPYAYKPSNFNLTGDLYLDAKNKAENIGSNFLVDGNSYVVGKAFDNVNVDHEHSETVEAGTYKTRKGFRKKRKTLYKTIHKTVVDSYANTQFSRTVELDIGTLKNNGIFLGQNIHGKVGHVENGIQSNQGQIAPLNPNSIPRFKNLPTPRAGGDIQASDELTLVANSLNNTGFIEADKTYLKVKGLFSNRRRLAEEQEDAIGKKRRGKTKVHHVTVDQIQPGGVIKGRILHIDAAQGKNQGGLISGRDEVKGSGGSFDNEALSIRSVNPSNHRAKNSFARAELLSGGTMDLNYTERFKNEASDVIVWKGVNLTAGEIIERSQFAINVEKDKKGWKKRSLEHSIVKEEGKIWSIKGPLNVKSTQGNIDIEGELGSFEGHVKVDSAQDILFRARTVSANNRVSGWKASFGKVNWQQTDYNVTSTVLPHFFAGDGAEFKGRNLEAAGLQLDVVGDVEGELKKSLFKSHKVNHYVHKKGFEIGVQAVGVQAVQAALNHEKPTDVGMALLREDPALDSVVKLAGSRDGVDVVKNGIGSAVKLWNEAAGFASAYHQGHLSNALGEHFGITDGKGNLYPRVAVSAEFTKEKREWTTSALSRLNIQGNWRWHVGEQIYQGAEIDVTKNADLKGDVFVGEAESDTFSMSRKGIKPSLSIGPSGMGVGLEYQQGSSKQRIYSNFKLNIGEKLEIQFKKSMRLSGAEVEADEANIKAPPIKVESKQDKFSQSHFKVGASTDGRFSCAMGNENASQVNNVSFIKARKEGVIDADYMQLIGANTQNIEIKGKQLDPQNIVDVKKGSALNVDFATPNPKKSQGINLLGEVDFKAHHQEVNVKPVVAGGNGKELGVATDLSKQREVIKDKHIHLAAPIVTANLDTLKREVEEMRKALHLQPIVQSVQRQNLKEEVKEKEVKKAERKTKQSRKEPIQQKRQKNNEPQDLVVTSQANKAENAVEQEIKVEIKDKDTKGIKKLVVNLMDYQLKEKIKQRYGENAGKVYKFINKALSADIPENSKNPIRDRVISVGVDLGINLLNPIKRLKGLGLNKALDAIATHVELYLNKHRDEMLKNKEAEYWWNRQWEATGMEGLNYAGAANFPLDLVKTLKIPEYLHRVITPRALRLCDYLNITEDNMVRMAKRTADLMVKSSPELQEEKAWQMAAKDFKQYISGSHSELTH